MDNLLRSMGKNETSISEKEKVLLSARADRPSLEPRVEIVENLNILGIQETAADDVQDKPADPHSTLRLLD